MHEKHFLASFLAHNKGSICVVATEKSRLQLQRTLRPPKLQWIKYCSILFHSHGRVRVQVSGIAQLHVVIAQLHLCSGLREEKDHGLGAPNVLKISPRNRAHPSTPIPAVRT